MKLDEIKEMWDVDSDIDATKIDDATLSVAKQANKYMKILAQERFVFNQLREHLKKMRREKYEYYTGKAPAAVYKEKPFNLVLVKADVGMYIDADEDIQKAILLCHRQEEKVLFLEQILDVLKSRRWDIRNFIEWQKFQAGV